MFADGTAANFFSSVPIDGGTAWIHSERHSINAKAESKATPEMMQGPMLQALLEDRLKLKIHRETREIPVYALAVAKGGLKLEQFKEGSCTPRPPIDLTKPPAPPPTLPSGGKYCTNVGTLKGPTMVVNVEGATLDDFLPKSSSEA